MIGRRILDHLKEGFVRADHPQIKARPRTQSTQAGFQIIDLSQQAPIAFRERFMGGLELFEPRLLLPKRMKRRITRPQAPLQTRQQR